MATQQTVLAARRGTPSARRTGIVAAGACVALVVALTACQPSPLSTDSAAPLACAPTVEHAVVSDARVGDLPTQPEWVDTGLRIASPPATWVWGVTVDDGLVLVKSGGLIGAPTELRLVEMPAGRVLWERTVTESAGAEFTEIYGPWQTGVDAITVHVQAPGSHLLIALSLEDGEELSRVELGPFGAVATSIRVSSSSHVFFPTAVVDRTLIVVWTHESIFAARPDALDAPVWSVPRSAGVVETYGDVVIVDGVDAYRFDTGASLDWNDGSREADRGLLVQLGDLLYDTGQGTALAPIDPFSGMPCGATESLHFAASSTDGYFVVAEDLSIRRFEPGGQDLGTLSGTMGADTFGFTIADRFAQIRDQDQVVTVYAQDGATSTVIGPLPGMAYAHDSQRLLTFNYELGQLAAHDLDTGDQVWATSEGRTVVQLWGGSLVSILSTPDSLAVSVLATPGSR